MTDLCDSFSSGAKHGRLIIMARQSLADFVEPNSRWRKTAAFEEWRRKLSRGDRLPRGRFFKGKRPGPGKIIMIDEAWRAFQPLQSTSQSQEVDAR